MVKNRAQAELRAEVAQTVLPIRDERQWVAGTLQDLKGRENVGEHGQTIGAKDSPDVVRVLHSAGSDGPPGLGARTQGSPGRHPHVQPLEHALREALVIELPLVRRCARIVLDVVPLEDVVQHLVLPGVRLEGLLCQVVHEDGATTLAGARIDERAVEVEGDGVDATRE